MLATTAVGLGSAIVGICLYKKGGRRKQKGGGKQKENIGTRFYYFLAEGQVRRLQNNTCWVIKMQPGLMLSGAVVIYGVRARIQCWQRVLLFPVLAGFALANMPFESAW